ncbi:MAG: hypothetical protein RTU30_04280 [Candidatus Thorarchaeota archaeon]
MKQLHSIDTCQSVPPMIRNVIVLDINGRSLLTANFGDCHSLGEDPLVVSGFISAVHSFSKTLSGQGVDEIKLGSLNFLIQHHGKLLFVMTSDEDDAETNKSKLKRVVRFFLEMYSGVIETLDEDTNLSVFDGFGQGLVDIGFAEKNCRENPDCDDCENTDKTIPVREVADHYR